MKIKVPVIDGRTFEARMFSPHDVIDEETGKVIGHISCLGTEKDPESRWTISLFDKYTKSFETRDQAWAFAKGVETVLNHMVSMPSDKAVSRAA